MATVRRMGARLPLGFGLTFVVLAGNALVCSWTMRDQVENHRWVNHTREVQTALAELHASLANAVARERRYVITGDEQALAPYRTDADRSRALIAEVRRQTADNPEQQARVATLERRADALLAQLDQCVATRRDQGFEAAMAIVRSGRAESLGDEVRGTIAAMTGAERDLLERRESVTTWAIRRTVLTLSAATALSLTMLGTVFLLTRGYIRRRDEADAARRQSEERFRILAEAVPQIVWVSRPDGHHEYFNRRWYEYTGMTPGESIGQGWSRPIHPDDKARSERRWAEATTAGAPYEIEYRFRAADGNYRWFLGRALPLHDDAGRIVRWFGTCTDIELQKRTEAELEQAKEVAEAASRAKDQFLAMLSHELRTPLNPVLMAVTAVLDIPGTSRDQREMFEMIRQNIELEARLIDDLLDVMRVIRGKMHYQWSVVDLHVLIQRTFDICRSDWLGKQIALVAPLEARRHHVQADPARLQQVLWNLVKNAVKFTPAGGTITIRSRDDDGHVTVEVADTGLGIAPGDLPRIFNAFEQVEDPRTLKLGGLGLGLAISRSIAEAHGGTLTAESPGLDLGATFTLTLPTVAPQPREESAAPPVVVADHRQQLNLLLVEDDLVSARIMSKLLRGVGHSVRTAHSVASAIEAASPDIDLVVSDLGLPDGSGLDLMSRIKQEYGLSGIALTGFGMDGDIEKSRRAGFVAHLTKPVDFSRLEATIQRVAAMSDR
jgi:PAS domain S-box-containing protein